MPMYFGAADVFVGILRGIHLKKGDDHDNSNTTCAVNFEIREISEEDDSYNNAISVAWS